jgi:hypothetical protein
LYYTPFQYPHPWQAGGAVPTTPAPPTNLRIISALMGFLPVIAGVHLMQRRNRRSR